jgi:hypothetical protein
LESERRQDIALVIDIWDDSESVRGVEELADAIDQTIDRKHESTPDFHVYFIHNAPWRLPLPDPQKNIKRLQLRYICQTYFRGGTL